MMRRETLLSCLPIVSVITAGCCPTSPLSQFQFKLYHPREVRIYDRDANGSNVPDLVFVYFRLENASDSGKPLCFAHWSIKHSRWQSCLPRLTPVLMVTSEGAPILSAETRLSGLSDVTIHEGSYFPRAVPDEKDFPYNEAHFRRDFCIAI